MVPTVPDPGVHALCSPRSGAWAGPVSRWDATSTVRPMCHCRCKEDPCSADSELIKKEIAWWAWPNKQGSPGPSWSVQRTRVPGDRKQNGGCQGRGECFTGT